MLEGMPSRLSSKDLLLIKLTKYDTIMGIWDNIKNTTSEWSSSLRTKANQFQNEKFADASMAICALVAAADGNVDAEERSKTASLIMNNDALDCFDAEDLKDRFNKFCDKLDSDFDFGKIALLQTIGKLRGKDSEARALIQIGIIIGGADGHFDPDEKKVVGVSCRALGLNPTEFDL
jgi:tellurite resistance protein TerB